MFRARTGRCGVRAICAILRTPCFRMFRWGIGFGTGRQRCRNVAELVLEVVLEPFGLELLLPRLRRQALLRYRSRRGGVTLRFSQIIHRKLNLRGSVLLLLQPLLSNLRLLLQLLLQSPLGRLRLLLETPLEKLLLLQRLLLLLPLLLQDGLEHPFVALNDATRGIRGGPPILLDAPLHLELLLHQLLLLLLLLLQNAKDHIKIGASSVSLSKT